MNMINLKAKQKNRSLNKVHNTIMLNAKHICKKDNIMFNLKATQKADIDDNDNNGDDDNDVPAPPPSPPAPAPLFSQAIHL